MIQTARLLLVTFLLLWTCPISADPVAVRYLEGSVHGFLSLRSAEGKILAAGDLTQVIHGSRVISRLVFRFRDGSVDDETSVFSQRKTFQLISDRHIQKGPAFPHPCDVTINAMTGKVTTRYRDKDQQKVETEQVDLPKDLANGLILDVLKNISPDSDETKLSYLAATPKPRIVHLTIKPQGEGTFSIAGIPHQAMRFMVKIDLGGIEGIVAPLIGKQPADMDVWVAGGQAPAFVKMEGPLFLGGPMWRIEMTSPVWP